MSLCGRKSEPGGEHAASSEPEYASITLFRIDRMAKFPPACFPSLRMRRRRVRLELLSSFPPPYRRSSRGWRGRPATLDEPTSAKQTSSGSNWFSVRNRAVSSVRFWSSTRSTHERRCHCEKGLSSIPFTTAPLRGRSSDTSWFLCSNHLSIPWHGGCRHRCCRRRHRHAQTFQHHIAWQQFKGHHARRLLRQLEVLW